MTYDLKDMTRTNEGLDTRMRKELVAKTKTLNLKVVYVHDRTQRTEDIPHADNYLTIQ